ncbi:MAG TPA: 3-hydroxybutyrate dehydrogenase [Rhodocyclaceae bacterium]|nr:3-hydroxybutyrate dehydrogenase [Rhodocyclaceae bacterium]HMW77249.1 3-hydroxybutyrate dehydrogenase [Rhodocyclaceae bacterium]HNE41597.1 3-hydroxybutyrate dehydrogenase [Rhodocyclaceae bacterium]HNM23087.1 3-hydroxybutyrate dehydrogenase [Rhodocyclaceae bacterium]HNM80987.1 3-hydroxybutyrate dehydrogenase [Rhodocyclaceae bacterium]
MLKGKSAIVTGSTSGIGLGIARALAAQGANVMLNGFGDADQIETLRFTLARETGVKVAYSGADMSQPEAIRAMADAARSEFGQVDIIVNNAGIQHVAPVEDFPEEKWNAILAINLSSAFHLIRAVVPEMKERRWGRIVNVASAHGLTASPFKSAYVAAKHGMIGLSKTVALEVAEFGITCNTVCPGYVKTPLVEKQIADQAKAHGISPENVVRDVLLSHQARKEFVQVEELAALTVFLCSDAAASMTATALAMDGGWSQH